MSDNQNDDKIIDIVTTYLENVFNFVGWDRSDFKEIVNNQNDNLTKGDVGTEQLIKICEYEVIKKIPKKIAGTNDNKIIADFIEFISMSKNYNKYTKLQIVAIFLNSIKEYRESISYLAILESNQALYQIINSNIDLNNIEKQKMQVIMNDNSINWLIEDYCSINNIDILDIIENNISKCDTTIVEHDSIYTLLRSAISLTKEEKESLIREYKQGNKKAKDLLVKGHLRFICSIARKYVGQGVPLLDLIQEGTIGFMKAMEKYDLEGHSNVQITSYAHDRIRQAVGRCVANNGKSIRLPVNIGQRRNMVINFATKLEFHLHREPTYQEIADKAGLTVKQVEEIYKLPDVISSIDDIVREENDTSFVELIKDEYAIDPQRAAEQKDIKDRMQGYLSRLKSRRTEQILRMRFGVDTDGPMTLEQIGQEFNLTRERIRQLESDGLEELKKIIEKENKRFLYYQMIYYPESQNKEVKQENNMGKTKKKI